MLGFSRFSNGSMSIQPTSLKNALGSVRWRSVGDLWAILMATTLSWMAYGLFQAQILQGMGFSQLGSWLGIFQGLHWA
jgi:hypothetical protein